MFLYVHVCMYIIILCIYVYTTQSMIQLPIVFSYVCMYGCTTQSMIQQCSLCMNICMYICTTQSMIQQCSLCMNICMYICTTQPMIQHLPIVFSLYEYMYVCMDVPHSQDTATHIMFLYVSLRMYRCTVVLGMVR